MGERTMFVERYTVVPAVDVEALRAALRAVAARPGVRLAFGPSLLGTLEMDALPVGLHPFVDPDRVVLPLRDDVVLLLSDDPAADPAAVATGPLLAGTAILVERLQVGAASSNAVPDGVLVLVRHQAGAAVRARWSVAPDPASADRVLADLVAEGAVGDHGRTSADLYAALAPERVAEVLAPRDG